MSGAERVPVPPEHQDVLRRYLAWLARRLPGVPGLVPGEDGRLLSRCAPRRVRGAVAGEGRDDLGERLELEGGCYRLTAGPGEGKTTLLRHLCAQRIERAARSLAEQGALPRAGLPILLDAAELGASPPASVAAARFAPDLPIERAELRGALEEAIEQGSAVLLIDEADAAPPELRAALGESLRAWSGLPGAAPAVLAGRPEGTPDPGWTALALEPLSTEEQLDLLGRLSLPQEATEALLAACATPGRGDLGRSPLGLRLLAAEQLEGRPLSDRLVHLLRGALDRLVQHGAGRGLPAASALRRGLGELVLGLWQEGSGPWSPAACERALAGAETSALLLSLHPELLDALTERGLLHRNIAGNLGLPSRILAELLVAEALHRRGPAALIRLAVPERDGPWTPASWDRPAHAPRWAQVFALLAGLAESPGEVVALLPDRDLALRALAEAERVPLPRVQRALLGEPALGPVRELVRRLSGEERAQALRELGATAPGWSPLVAAALLVVGVEEGLPPEGGLPARPWVTLPPGRFWMGSPDEEGEAHERPRHAVSLTGPVQLLAVPVTQGLYGVVTGETPSRFAGDWRRPVERVSWTDAARFCAAWGALLGRPVRLPTEAEWEYACRAGTQGPWSCPPEALPSSAWHAANSQGATWPVATRAPNPWGLYDLHGNVWEWVADRWDKEAYRRGPAQDPVGPAEGGLRTLRGGSWKEEAAALRSAARAWGYPGFRGPTRGFRVARLA